ncbi:formimidoylglutamase [Nesterenkonia natronophila]|uniref:Formimidoylglutamase n=1 Tax=Nesterenkonia natronophila TaxID=2174932 RepID=A0A3A4F480_9MICC|nr:formimidoylglutamase [Nesterenkonia natronophila]RJN32541.1 formimidoylglutamase [Nesterenkonia natronophila]
MDTEPVSALWTGRQDGEGPHHTRWHEAVRVKDPHQTDNDSYAAQQVSLLGFRTDEGIRRNNGRVGAADGPTALRRALAPFALHGQMADGQVRLTDYGDVVTEGEDLEAGQAAAAQAITGALDAPGAELAVVLGGGHETAWASYQGLMNSAHMRAEDGRRPQWGVLNLDAHFDLRQESRPTSGTPFLQIAQAEQAAGFPDLRYAVVGIAEPANTGALFAQARRLGVRWMTDVECAGAGAGGIARFIADFAANLDVLYLTIDLDLLPAAVAPGVSAPAALGVDTALVLAAVRAAAATRKLRLVDVVELNPPFDEQGRTARTAARLIDEAVRTVLMVEPHNGFQND